MSISDSIERETLIDAPPAVVWNVITDPAQIRQWFCDGAELDARPGGHGAFSWGELTVDLRVVRVEQPRLFAFRWLYAEGEEPRESNSTLVEFTLSPEGQGTRLQVVESGLDATDWSDERKAEVLDTHTDGWQRHVADLTEFAGQRQVAAR